ncbi:MAG TPA: hypothetical protein VK922_16425 [Gemmatimonadaceae bacterium]|nr:hypothetical protein [Gemmatimonadaceae bacterium]
MNDGMDRTHRRRRTLLTVALGALAAVAGVTAGMALGGRLGGESTELRVRAADLLRQQLAAVRELDRHDVASGCVVTLELDSATLSGAAWRAEPSVDTLQIVVSAFTRSAIDSIERGGAIGRDEIRAVTATRSSASLRASRVHTATVPDVPCGDIARFGALVLRIRPSESPPRAPVPRPGEEPPPAVIA